MTRNVCFCFEFLQLKYPKMSEIILAVCKHVSKVVIEFLDVKNALYFSFNCSTPFPQHEMSYMYAIYAIEYT